MGTDPDDQGERIMSEQEETREDEPVRIEIEADKAFNTPIEVIPGKKMQIILKNPVQDTSE
jgi:hypothetical protein